VWRKLANYRPPLIGIVGKTNVGKSTLFSALTMSSVEVSNRPFTTIEPNHGVAYVRRRCPHVEFNLPSCNPRNGYCLRGTRFIPVEIMDVAGLIKGAHEGRGLGNKFMDDIRQADAFILVVDASGSTDEEGNPVEPGSRDPVQEARDILDEIRLWFEKVVSKDWDKFALATETGRKDPVEALFRKLSGLSIPRRSIVETLTALDLLTKKLVNWTRDDIRKFSYELLEKAKPFIIAANKADLPSAEENIKKLTEAFPDKKVVPVSAAAELALKKASEQGIISYTPGDSDFRVTGEDRLSPQQKKALDYIRKNVMEKWGGTGVQQALETLIFDVLGMITVFTVEDATHLTDSKGNVLPDAYLVPSSFTAKDVAGIIHSDLAERFVYAIDVRRKSRIGDKTGLYDGIILKIVVAR